MADALLDALGSDFTVVCPAFPANARTIYKGRLFVGDVPLDESGMRDHPLTPMRDASLIRVMGQQTRRRVGLAFDVIRQGPKAIRAAFETLHADGVAYAVTDALTDDDLMAIGAACEGMALVTAGSGLALGLGPNFDGPAASAAALPGTGGKRAVIAGSCSSATRRQVAVMRSAHPAFQITPAELARGEDIVSRAVDWANQHDEPFLIYATAEPEEVQAAQSMLGAAQAGSLVEEALAAIARQLVDGGVGQMIVAGGETSGAVVRALDMTGLTIGAEIVPGVPWTATMPREGRSPLAADQDRRRLGERPDQH